ncbi:MAG: galactokinase family protein [Muribaculaceae bacterium]|nr:galactokinase family protein [Muribaculaceae bacterium]
MKDKLTKEFKSRFNEEPLFYASAGRINLIGEHTDYNGG